MADVRFRPNVVRRENAISSAQDIFLNPLAEFAAL